MLNRTIWLLAATALTVSAAAQDSKTLKIKPESNYNFTVVKDIEATGVQDQSRTGTCWSFSALGFFESELIRMGKGEHNLSEMWVVANAYKDKAERYVRMHGHTNFGSGGGFVDIPHVWSTYGVVPESAYSGLLHGEEKHNHAELDNILTAYANAVIENKQKTLTPGWKRGIDAVVDAYLGETPEEFEYRGKTYTPQSFADMLGLNTDDYVSLTSFSHHPFHEPFVLEIPDNWLHKQSYNLPIDELMQVVEEAIMAGYSFAWGADVSEKGFAFREGLAILPEDESTIEVKGKDNAQFNNAGAAKISNAFETPVKQKEVTQEMRQEQFDNWQTTDDHGMQITGIVKDQNGERYYMVKNSWGTRKYNDLEGYFIASEAYLKLKTINIYLHKDAVPKEIRKKLGI